MLLGFASYLILVRAGGGFGQYLSYTGGRADIFRGAYGGYFWVSFFLISGLSVIGAAIVARRPWTVFALGIAIGALLALFQGRAAAISPVFVSIALIYYGYKRLPTRTLAITAVVLFFFSSLLGAYRVTENKSMAGSNTAGFIANIYDNALDNFRGTLAVDIERLDMFLVCYKYVSKEGKALGGKNMLGWLSPVDRALFGGSLELEHAGPFINSLVNPHQRFNRTGSLPSLIGELYLNFGLWGLLLGQLLYGVLLKQISAITRQHPIKPLNLSVYPYINFIVTYVVLTGTVQLFYLVVVMTGIFIATMISGFRPAK